ncbi:hypothetical protein SCHPADRAFT_686394 [Schizopora paradoxa]|uniref:Uncharacterized protein n=1 Tax=Schizopora paradoxa TaxID=27342 RepID=A0A0H2R461_9AGAM|nr:hypothetical protein SCHPADRAFT_686394 [Schizopora paradoxa]
MRCPQFLKSLYAFSPSISLSLERRGLRGLSWFRVMKPHVTDAKMDGWTLARDVDEELLSGVANPAHSASADLPLVVPLFSPSSPYAPSRRNPVVVVYPPPLLRISHSIETLTENVVRGCNRIIILGTRTRNHLHGNARKDEREGGHPTACVALSRASPLAAILEAPL